MRFEPLQVKDKLGRTVFLRNAEVTDAEVLLEYLKITAGETPYLLREPDEVKMTVEQERSFIQGRIDAPRELMLIAVLDSELIGSCSLMSAGPFKRYFHRCEVAIALYQKYCGAGIGEIMVQTLLEMAKKEGYEQAELEVVSGNAGAIALYQKLGFQEFGRLPNNMKYSDGSYCDAVWMMKKL